MCGRATLPSILMDFEYAKLKGPSGLGESKWWETSYLKVLYPTTTERTKHVFIVEVGRMNRSS